MKKIIKISEDIENENLQKLRAVFPNFVKDGEVDLDAIKAFFNNEGMLAGVEKYGLNWAGKNSAFKAIRTPSTGTLTPQEKESKDFDTTENIFIEGDNLEVLKLLQKHYREQIKMIYIDPPYNTGKDFIYTDNFTENKNDYYERTGQSCDGIKLTSNPESNGRYHSDWLTMMYPRLFLARNLLRDDGVIFVSINDHEVANLRMIMDEIFGEENFVAQMVWQNASRHSEQISNEHEYILCYVKNVDMIGQWKKARPEVQGMITLVEQLKVSGKSIEWAEKQLKTSIMHLVSKDKRKYGYLQNYLNIDENWHIYYPVDLTGEGEGPARKFGNKVVPPPAGRHWMGQDTIDELIKNDRLVFRADRAYRKLLLEESDANLKSVIQIPTRNGSELLKELLGKDIFDKPKPHNLLAELVHFVTADNDIILDFFAGSGTTAHAVMAQNDEDDGNRKWICVQIPEGTHEDSEACKAGYLNIAQISRERIRRAGAKIGKGDTGFKAFALSPSNYSEWNVLTDKDDEETLKKQSKLFIEQPLVKGFDEKSVVYEILLKEGYDLNAKVEHEKGDLNPWVIASGERNLVVTFAKKVFKEQVEKLSLSQNDTFVRLDSALDDTTKVNIMRNLMVKTI